jgi:hypothetical protein
LTGPIDDLARWCKSNGASPVIGWAQEMKPPIEETTATHGQRSCRLACGATHCGLDAWLVVVTAVDVDETLSFEFPMILMRRHTIYSLLFVLIEFPRVIGWADQQDRERTRGLIRFA